MQTRQFGTLPDGRTVTAYELENGALRCEILDLGGIVTKLVAPDRDGVAADIVLGCDDLEDYATAPYFGALIGRFGNRIDGGRFALDGVTYQLAQNDGDNHLHGGKVGFDKVIWSAETRQSDAGPSLALSHRSLDGEECYPGNLDVEVVYTLTADGLRIDYRATCDAPTILNLTNHSYFNLDGHDSGDICDHLLCVDAQHITPVSSALIPTGELQAVAGTPFDFKTPSRIGDRLEQTDDEQIARGGGIDHNFVFDTMGGFNKQAELFSARSGRVLEVWTDQPGAQVYTGNFLDGSVRGKGGFAYQKRAAICLETQHFPDSPNQPTFPSVVLHPGKTFRSTTEYRLAIRK